MRIGNRGTNLVARMRRLAAATSAFFRSLGTSLYLEARDRIRRMTVFQIALRIVILVIAANVIEQICDNNPVLDVVNVPLEFQNAGYTPDVIARTINDRIQTIDAQEKTLQLEQPRLMKLASDSPLPEMQLPIAGISLKSAILFVRQLLGFPPDRIVVDVTLDPLPAPASAASGGKPPGTRPAASQLRVVVRRIGGASTGDDAVTPIDQIPEADPEAASSRLAQDVMFEADPYTLGVYLLGQKVPELAKSEICFQKAAELDPIDAQAFYAWGYVLEDEARHDAAIVEYREAIRLKPDFANAHFNLGVALEAAGQNAAAVAEYREAIRLKPDFATAHDGLAAALQAKGQYDAAIAEDREAIRLNPDLENAHYNLGVELEAKNQHNDAIAEFGEAIRLNPDDADAHYNLGNALEATGQHDAAIAEDRKAISLKPDSANAHFNLAHALDAKGQHDAAVAQRAEAIRLNPALANAH
jgi:tetratricopeptide (TPR) repeat protein